MDLLILFISIFLFGAFMSHVQLKDDESPELRDSETILSMSPDVRFFFCFNNFFFLISRTADSLVCKRG